METSVVEGNAVGPAELRGDEQGPLRAVHGGALDLGLLAPVGPEHPAGLRVQRQRARLVQVLRDQHLPEPESAQISQRQSFSHEPLSTTSYLAPGAVEASHFDAVRSRVRPVKIAADPVHRQSVRMVHFRHDDILLHTQARCSIAAVDGIGTELLYLMAAVELGAPDSAHLVVAPVDIAVHRVVVDGDGVADAVQRQHHVRVVGRVQGDPPASSSVSDLSSTDQRPTLRRRCHT